MSFAESQRLSWETNSKMWPTARKDIQAYKPGFSDWSGDEEIGKFDDVVKNLSDCYKARLEGMNTLITEGKFTK